MKKKLLIILCLSTLIWAEFTKDGDIITDSKTTLQWQDDTTDTTMTWIAAIEYCENLSLGGNIDWRLPSLNELTSLVDDSRYNPSISAVFQNTVSDYYWSSTTLSRKSSQAWNVEFQDGYQYFYAKEDSSFVRCVRAGI